MQGGKWTVLASKHVGGERPGMRAVAYACIHARAGLFLFVFSFWMYKLLSSLLRPVSVKKILSKQNHKLYCYSGTSVWCSYAHGSLEGRCLRNRRRSWTLLGVYDNLVFLVRSRDCLLLRRRCLPTLSATTAMLWRRRDRSVEFIHRRCWVSVSISSIYLLVLFSVSSSICMFRCLQSSFKYV
jgi:hypothetical protein